VSSDAPTIVAPDGRPARKAASDRCPQCGAGPNKRVESECFGCETVTNCGNCGHQFEGATE